jgi:hypothetical protein
MIIDMAYMRSARSLLIVACARIGEGQDRTADGPARKPHGVSKDIKPFCRVTSV